MNEATGKTSSALAITEKRPHRPGGCVGIFFQLFDWNRKLAKKKLFSRKMLPSVRAKQTAKKFGGDEKMPKTKPHLIADENSGGFPNVKKNANRSSVSEQMPEMKTASLVARLMGLESMPTVHRDKQKKSSNSATFDVKEEKFVNTPCGSDGEVLNLDNGITKVESRPQKLQKTGQFERRAVTRFGAEALQIRNVLSRSRRHHHPKFVSPVKSPRISSSRNVSRASRLIDAATRILEPGLQATNRAKCALTYSSSKNYSPKNVVLIDGMGLGVMSPDLMKQQQQQQQQQQQNDVNYDLDVGKSWMGQTSCKNCGNLLDVVDSRPTVEEQQPNVCPSAANMANTSWQGLERIKPRPLISSSEQERDETYQQNQVKLSNAAERKDSPLACRQPVLERKLVFSDGQMPRQFRSQHCRSSKVEPTSIAFRQRTETRNHMSVDSNRIPPRAKLNRPQSGRASSAVNAIGAKDSVVMNRSLSGRTRPGVSTMTHNYAADTERKICSRRDDSLPQSRNPVRKRTVSGNAQLETTGLVSSTSIRQKNNKCDLISGKELEHNAHTVNHACIKNRSLGQRGGNRANGNKNHDVISFTFNSPLKHKNFLSSRPTESMHNIEYNASHERKLPSDVKTSLQRKLPLSGDTLGALLEQKLKELISQEEDESATGGSAPKRSTAMILQELISALVEQQPSSPHGHMFNAETTFQTQGRVGRTLVGFSHDSDHLSPGSVLEASFSNDSCFSSSVDDNSGRRLLYESVDYSCDELQTIETDADLMDSATSVKGRTCRNSVTDLLNYVSKILQSINLADGGLIGRRLTYVKEVILNAELLFGSVAPQNSERIKSSFIGPFLLDELETLAGAMWTNFGCVLGFEEIKESSQVKRFLFDSVIECLDSKYSRRCNSGYKAWKTLPSFMNAEMLIEELGMEIRRWTNMAEMTPDEIIDWEMSHSLGKWTDFEVEAFETGADIDWDILEVLVEEIVIDFWN